MAKLTKAQTALHESACALLAKETLTEVEQWEVIENWNPAANNNITVAGSFFTPMDLAHDLITDGFCNYNAIYLDICAGTGRLMKHLIPYVREYKNTYICIENNPEFIKVGKQCVPQAIWIQADCFDREVYQSILEKYGQIDYAFSNPPYGSSKIKPEWLDYHGLADLMVAEIICRVAKSGNMIIPPLSTPFDLANASRAVVNKEYEKWHKANPNYQFNRMSLDHTFYSFEQTAIRPYPIEIVDVEYENQFIPKGL